MLSDLMMTFKRKLNSRSNLSPKKKLRKSPENRSNGKSFGISGRLSSGDHYEDNNQDPNNNNNNACDNGGQSIYKVEIEKD